MRIKTELLQVEEEQEIYEEKETSLGERWPEKELILGTGGSLT